MRKFFTSLILLVGFGMLVNAQQNVPFTENFDNFNTCTNSCNATCVLINGFMNVTGDDGSWIVDAAGTSSGSTGPSIDHTLGNSTGRYIYYETSSPCYPNRTANLWSPQMNFAGVNAPQLKFWYHMFGATMGSMHIDVSTNGGSTWTLDVVPSRTDNVDLWQEWTIDLSSFAGDTAIVRWRGVSTSSFTSDMAIDDVNFFDLLPNDAGVTAIDSPSTPACNLGNNIWATIENFGTDSLTNVTVNWSINGTGQPSLSLSNLLLFQGEDTTIQVGTASITAGDDICVWTTLPNGVTEPASGSANDSVCINVGLGLAGTFSVGGAGADYPSLGATVADLNAKGVCGPVIFELNDSTFQEQLMFEEIIGASATNTITYRSLSGNNAACRIEWGAFQSLQNYTIFFNGADYIHFENLTVGAVGTTYGRVLDFFGGADWNEFNNCILQGTPNNTTTSTFKVVIWSTPGSNDNHNHFIDNVIENGSYGVYWYGTSITSLEEGTVFEGNTFLNNYYYGSRLYYMDAPRFVGNTFESSTPYTGSVWRFYFFYCDNDMVIANNVSKGSQYGYGIYLGNCDGNPNNHSRVYNNMITVGNPTTTSTSYALYMTNSGYQDVAHNSFHTESNGTSTRAGYITSGGANNVWNNNFTNSGPGYAVYILSQFSILDMDYNNLYSPNGRVGYFNADQTTLSAWQTATGWDASSVSVDPNYYDPLTDLHVCNDTLDGAGFPLAWVEKDIDDQFRLSPPDIGADEFVSIAGFSLGADTTLCAGDTLFLVAGSPSDTILWNTGATTSTLIVTAPGTYSVSVNGVCGSASDAIVVSASAEIFTGFLASTAGPITCDGDTVWLSSTYPAETYLWSTGDTTSSIAVTTSGTYTLDITDNCGSGSESSTLTFESAPTAGFTLVSSFLSGGFTNTSTGAGTLTYGWDFGDALGTSTLENPVYVYGDTGTYTVTLTVTNECGSDVVTGTIIIVGDTSGSVGVAEQLENGNVIVYPNPSNGNFNVGLELNGAHVVTISVQNLQGQEVSTSELGSKSGEFTESFDLSSAAAGIYFVKVRVDNEFVVRKLIVE